MLLSRLFQNMRFFLRYSLSRLLFLPLLFIATVFAQDPVSVDRSKIRYMLMNIVDIAATPAFHVEGHYVGTLENDPEANPHLKYKTRTLEKYFSVTDDLLDGNRFRAEIVEHLFRDGEPVFDVGGTKQTLILEQGNFIYWNHLPDREEATIGFGSESTGLIDTSKMQWDPFQYYSEIAFSGKVDFAMEHLTKAVKRGPHQIEAMFYIEKNNRDDYVSIIFDERAGFMPVVYNYIADSKKIKEKRTYNISYKKYLGRWLPSEIKITSSTEPWSSGYHNELVTFKNIEILDEIDSSIFEPNFPEGTRIYDKRTGVQIAGTDSIIDRMAEEVLSMKIGDEGSKPLTTFSDSDQSLRQKDRPKESFTLDSTKGGKNNRFPTWLLGVACVVVIGIIVFYLRKSTGH